MTSILSVWLRPIQNLSWTLINELISRTLLRGRNDMYHDSGFPTITPPCALGIAFITAEMFCHVIPCLNLLRINHLAWDFPRSDLGWLSKLSFPLFLFAVHFLAWHLEGPLQLLRSHSLRHGRWSKTQDLFIQELAYAR